MGRTNSFVGLDPSDLTGSVYNSQQLVTDPKALGCFAFELLVQAAPDLLEGIFTDVTPAVNQLAAAIKSAEASLGADCKPISDLQYSQFGQFPGYTQSYNGYQPQSVLGSILGGLGGLGK